VQIARVVDRLGFSDGLNPAQWSALRYFGRANRFSRSVSAFASFPQTTRGTASQRGRALVAKGLLERRTAASDRRAACIELTETGVGLLARDPLRCVESALERLQESDRLGLSRALAELNRHIDRHIDSNFDSGTVRFGRCADCQCLRKDNGDLTCGVAAEPLRHEELDLTCINYVASTDEALARRTTL
jgi:DNA-binding MarR family transcriptional regulator